MKVFGIVGWKNSGKTGLVERLVTEFSAKGITLSTLKHAHHEFEIDHEGRDSFRHRTAGAKEVAIVSANRWAMIHELQGEDEPGFDEMLAKMERVDLVLVEGYKRGKHPKIFCHRSEAGPLDMQGIDAVAVASDVAIDGLDVPNFDLNDIERIADFIDYYLDLR
ncbi:MAG: molybdopterin-guanine dinucleotide biosynthesis protein B [Pseudomonadota bacterium]